MVEYLFANNAIGALDAAIGTGDTLLSLETGQGALFPAPAAGQQFALLVFETGKFEWMTCTNVAGDNLTVIRSGSPQAFSLGAAVEHRLDSVALSNFLQAGGERTVTSDPDGVLTPLYFGEEVYNSITGVWWKSTTGTEWKELNL